MTPDALGFYSEVRPWRGSDIVLFGVGQGRAYSLLGNMARCPIELGSLSTPCSESLYQASRFPHDRVLQREIASLDGHAAKRAARSQAEHTAQDWVARRRVAMFAVLNLKLPTPRVSYCLLRTGSAPIIEVSPDDMFWGATHTGECLLGANLLGRMWMMLRSLREEQRATTYQWATQRSVALWPHLN
jgi:predicted NAD-dependent protein-ADP-ribosyltransferase YbiA (DUF1768 family)